MKALFRCLLAYSDGHPVAVFDVEENRLHGDEALTAIAKGEAALKVAVVRGLSGSDFDATEWPELLAAAMRCSERIVDYPVAKSNGLS
jgi:hypothetical protein